MFNVGKIVKIVALVLGCLATIACIIIGIVLMASDDESILTGLAIIFGGSFLSWVSAICMYGFGQLVENSDKLIKKKD